MRCLSIAIGALLAAATTNAAPQPHKIHKSQSSGPSNSSGQSNSSDDAPADTESASIYGMTVQYTGGGTGVSITKVNIEGDVMGDIYCENPKPQWPHPTEAYTCNNDSYRYAIFPGARKDQVRIRLYHIISEEKQQARWGQAYCNLACTGDYCVLHGPPNCDFEMHLGTPPDYP